MSQEFPMSYLIYFLGYRWISFAYNYRQQIQIPLRSPTWFGNFKHQGTRLSCTFPRTPYKANLRICLEVLYNVLRNDATGKTTHYRSQSYLLLHSSRHEQYRSQIDHSLYFWIIFLWDPPWLFFQSHVHEHVVFGPTRHQKKSR